MWLLHRAPRSLCRKQRYRSTSLRDLIISKDNLYKVKEIFYTLQGEGAQAGRPSVFCRFSKCNLWSGKEKSRENSICNFCDTDFNGTDGQNGGTYTKEQLVELIASLWPDLSQGTPYVVCTGGEPLLQLDTPLINALHDSGFQVGVETNSTLPAPHGIDWRTVRDRKSTRLNSSHVRISYAV